MRRTVIQVHRGSTCNNTTVVILVLLLSIVTSLTTSMAWTMHRSVRQLAARWHSSSSSSSSSLSSLFLLTNPAAGRTFGSFRGTSKSSRRAFERRTASTSTRLNSYQDFLQEHPHDNILVSYFTDIEGDKFYLDRYVDNSKILTWIPNEETKDKPKSMMYSSSNQESSFPYDRRIDFSHSNSILVFGGDLWDKGGFDLYVTRQLLDLKRRYPDRVVWVLGNRDINKLRMTQELGLPSSSQKVPYHPGLTWFRNSGRVGDPNGPLPSMDPGERLKWILGNTMGSPDAMEHRRRELLWESRGCQEADSKCIDGQENTISDLEIVRSYQESCHPNGEMGRFLSEGLLAAKVGPILFVHGSLPLTKDTMKEAKEKDQSIWDDLTFCMPWINKTHHEYDKEHKFATASDLGVNSIEDWLGAVNKFCVQNVEAWKKHTLEMEQEEEQEQEESTDEELNEEQKEASKEKIWAYRAGYGNGPSYSGTHYSDLVQYGMGMIPGGTKNPTVVYNSFTPEGMPTYFLPSEESETDSHPSDVAICTREFFEQSPLQLILTGHKPQGDMPSPIKVDGSSWVICADTSYSGDTKWFHDAKNSTDLDVVEKRKQLEERQNLGRGKSISFRGETAVSEVLVELSEGATSLKSIRYHGVLSDGTEYESVNLVNDNNKETNNMETSIGQVAPTSLVPDPSNSPHEGRWWTKGVCRDGSRLYYAGEGYNVWNYIVSPDAVESDETRTTSSN